MIIVYNSTNLVYSKSLLANITTAKFWLYKKCITVLIKVEII